MRQALANAAMFNLSWLLIVASESALLAWLLAAAHVALHLRLMGRGRGEWHFILAVSALGLLLDQLLFAAGVLQANGGPAPAPLWLSALWPVFATTAVHAFAGLARLPGPAAAAGALGGYASYRLGASLTAVSIGNPPLGDAVLLVLWALLFPALLAMARAMVRKGCAVEHVR